MIGGADPLTYDLRQVYAEIELERRKFSRVFRIYEQKHANSIESDTERAFLYEMSKKIDSLSKLINFVETEKKITLIFKRRKSLDEKMSSYAENALKN